MSRPWKRELTPIDWDGVRDRLNHARQVLAELTQPSAERTRRILDERARHLAALTAATDDDRPTVEVLSFEVGGSRYAIETRYVHEIVTLDHTPVAVPGTPSHFIGVVAHRGEILAIVDLGSLFQTATAPQGCGMALALGDEQVELGVCVNDVLEVSSLPADALKTPERGATGREASSTGVARVAGELVVLDGPALFADPRLIVDHGSIEGGQR